MRVTKLLVAAACVWAMAATPAWGNHGAGDLRNCGDFTYQEEAQAHFNAHPGDPDNLDADNDNIACEELPRRDRNGTTQTTVGGGGGTTQTTVRGSTTQTTVAGRTTPLVRTGSENGQLATAATVLVAGGAALLALGNRRRRAEG